MNQAESKSNSDLSLGKHRLRTDIGANKCNEIIQHYRNYGPAEGSGGVGSWAEKRLQR